MGWRPLASSNAFSGDFALILAPFCERACRGLFEEAVSMAASFAGSLPT